MQAIILAAGRGQRLSGYNPDGLPKSLLEFGGKSLIARELEWLEHLGIDRVDLVVGHGSDVMRAHVHTLRHKPEVIYTENPRFREGSVISLLAAADTLRAGDDVLVMDADVLFHPLILRRLVESRHGNCFLLDRDFVPGDEPVKIAVQDGVMVDFRKRLPDDLEYEQLGESVGFFRFDSATGVKVAEVCAGYDARGEGDAPHEEALRDLLLAEPGHYGFEDVSGLPWLEVDFPEDVERGRNEILARIREDHPEY